MAANQPADDRTAGADPSGAAATQQGSQHISFNNSTFNDAVVAHGTFIKVQPPPSPPSAPPSPDGGKGMAICLGVGATAVALAVGARLIMVGWNSQNAVTGKVGGDVIQNIKIFNNADNHGTTVMILTSLLVAVGAIVGYRIISSRWGNDERPTKDE